MNFNLHYIGEKHRLLILDIKGFWNDLDLESHQPIWHLRQFAFPWAIFVFVINIARCIPNITLNNFISSIDEPIITIGLIFLGAYILKKVSNSFVATSRKTFLIILNYASIPFFIGLCTSNIISLLSLIILWTGFEAKIVLEKNKRIRFFIISVIVLMVLYVLATIILVLIELYPIMMLISWLVSLLLEY